MIDETIYRTLRYQSTAPAAEVLTNLGQLQLVRERLARKARFWLFVLVAWLVLTLGGPVTIGAGLLAGPSAVLAAFLVGLIGAVVFGVLLARARRRVPEKKRYEVAARVLKHLACDMAPEEPVTILLDLNGYRQNDYRTQSGKVGRVAVHAYQLPWLSLEGALLDGNRFRLQSALLATRKERSKPKYTKVKEQFWEAVTLALKVKTADAAGLEPWPGFLRAARLPSQVAVKKAHQEEARLTVQVVTPRRLRLKDRTGTTGKDAPNLRVDEHAVLMLFLASYQALSQCRVQRKGA